MAFNIYRYDYVYGTDMLDTLHNYFPELMYDRRLFSTPTIEWMRHRIVHLFPEQYTRYESRYRLYQSERRYHDAHQWLQNNPQNHGVFQNQLRQSVQHTPAAQPLPAQPLPAQPLPNNRQASQRIEFNTTQPIGGTTIRRIPLQTNPLQTNPLQTNPLQTNVTGTIHAQTDILNLTDLVRLLTGLHTHIPGDLEDVIVAPTDQQINNGSTVLTNDHITDQITCAICQDTTQGDSWRLLHCNHSFHDTCIRQWFRQNTHCPVCRADIRDVPHIQNNPVVSTIATTTINADLTYDDESGHESDI